MKKIFFLGFISVFYFSFALYASDWHPVTEMKKVELNMAGIDIFSLIGQQKENIQKTNLFVKKKIDFLFKERNNMQFKKKEDFLIFFLNQLTEKEREIMYTAIFKRSYIYIKNTADTGSGTKSAFYFVSQKLEKCLRRELKKISKKKYRC